jgi:DNA (cytosine-5)-methyltransferase 1
MPKLESKPLIKRTDAEMDAFAAVTHKRSHPRLYQNPAKPADLGITKGALAEIRSIVHKSSLRNDHPLRKETRKERFTFIDLFAGIGGFRLAGDNSGGKCIFTSEKDKFARISYYKNFGELPFGDITILANTENVAKIPDHDVLCGGFPCQAFSISGDQLGFADPRGSLFFNIIDIIKNKISSDNPVKVVFLENVRNFEKHDGEKTFKIVQDELDSLGYSVTWAVLNSGNFGAATTRERIYIVAILDENFPDRNVSDFKAAFAELKILKPDPKFLKDHYLEKLSDKEAEPYIIPEVRIMTDKNQLEERDLIAANNNRAQPVQIGCIGKKGDSRMGRQGERIYSIHGQAITFSAYGGGLAARTGAYRTISKTGETQIRKLTPSECAKIMGFFRTKSDGEIKSMDVNALREHGLSDWQLYKQFGNSVVVPTVEKIYRLIADHLFPEKLSIPE